MQEKNNIKSNFFDRLMQIFDYYGIKSVKSFACDYLNYKSPEKINRLKDVNNKPSYDILCDISNRFEEISIQWLMTGQGTMLKCSQSTNISMTSQSNDSLIPYSENATKIMEENNRLFEIVEELRKQGRIVDYVELAKMLGTNKAGISDLKQSRKRISIEILKGMKTSYHDVNTDWILTGEGDMFLQPKESITPPNIDNSLVEFFTNKIEQQAQEIGRLKEVNENLEVDNQELRKVIVQLRSAEDASDVVAAS